MEEVVEEESVFDRYTRMSRHQKAWAFNDSTWSRSISHSIEAF